MRVAKPVPQGWHPADIKAAVAKRGLSLSELARNNGLPEHACRHALRYPYAKAEIAIADLLEKSPATLWPDRYNPDGSTKHPPRLPNHISDNRAATHRQKVAAA
jgi:Ner family transcriptional regulator